MGPVKAGLFTAYHLIRKVGFLASKKVVGSSPSSSIWIHEIEKDKAKGESDEQYIVRSFGQYAERITASLGDIKGELAFIHLSTTSERRDLTDVTRTAFDMYGGHIVFALAKLDGNSIRVIPEAYMSKGFDPNVTAIEGPEDAKVIDADGTVKFLKSEEYRRHATFHDNDKSRIDRFLVAHKQPKKGLEFGSRQYLIVLPLGVLGLTAELVKEYIKQYRNDPENGNIYDRMNDACTHAAVASVGISSNVRGLDTQEAAMMIVSLIISHNEDLYYGFRDAAQALGLSFTPAEVYNKHVQQKGLSDEPNGPKSSKP